MFCLYVRIFQKATNLQISGKLDSATLAMMNKPRCGVEDPFNDKSLKYRVMGGWLYSYDTFWLSLRYRYVKIIFIKSLNCSLIQQVTGARRCWPTASITTPLTWVWERPDPPFRVHLSTGVTCHLWGSRSFSKEELTSRSPSTERTGRVQCRLMGEVETAHFFFKYLKMWPSWMTFDESCNPIPNKCWRCFCKSWICYNFTSYLSCHDYIFHFML